MDVSERNLDMKDECREQYSRDQECENCGDVPEQVILLGCNHLVCLECLSGAIIEQTQEDVDLARVACFLCQEVTEISEEVQDLIIDYLNKQADQEQLLKEEQES